jgi:putative ABC transport system substrate-binding protein
MRRRQFIAGLGSAAAWPVAARGQQPVPVVGFINGDSAAAGAGPRAAFQKGLGETGYIEGQNVTVEYHYLDGRYDRQPALMADLIRRRVAVIVSGGGEAIALAANEATSTIPIVSSSGDDPVKRGLVAGLARPGAKLDGPSIRPSHRSFLDLDVDFARVAPTVGAERETQCEAKRRSSCSTASQARP